jgi:hypothetical protein
MKKSASKKLTTAIMAMMAITAVGCESKKATFSLLSEENVYAQSQTYVPRKIDVLWVVDNSGSMDTSQKQLAENFQSFINRFETLKFDFHLGVAATDSWKSLFVEGSTHSLLRDGYDSHSGVFVIDRNTPDLSSVFMTNVKLGVRGTGDERAFQSFKATLNNPNNANFRRPDAFLAIIIVSDEDDFSHPSYTFNHGDYNDPTLEKVSEYVDFLDQYTEKDPHSTLRNYSVSAITIQNQECVAQLGTDGFDRYPGKRYLELAEATGGIKGDLCGPFGQTLEIISDAIIDQSSVFPLTRLPIVESIRIHVNGVEVPNSDTAGWTYRAEDNSIVFHGNSVPEAGASIAIDFDPVGVKL